MRVLGVDPGLTRCGIGVVESGSGRSVAARAFAAALQCPDGGDGTCHACRTVLAGTHADVTVIVPDGLSIGAKEARELVRLAGRAPSRLAWSFEHEPVFANNIGLARFHGDTGTVVQARLDVGSRAQFQEFEVDA